MLTLHGDWTDPEDLAVKELAGRAARLRQIPWLSGIIGGIPPFSFALRIAQRLGDAAVTKRAPGWAEEQLRRHELPPGALDEYLSVL